MPRLFRSNLFRIVVAVAVFVILGVLAWLFLLGPKDQTDDDQSSLPVSTSLPAQTQENINTETANSYLVKKDPESAIAVYQKVIDSATSSEAKADAYLARASMLYSYDSAAYKEQILQDSYAAEKINPSAKTATFIYDMETRFGDLVAAEKYLTIIKERTPSDNQQVE